MYSLSKVAPTVGACLGSQSIPLGNRSSQIAVRNASGDPSESSFAADASKPQSRHRPRRLAVTTVTRGRGTRIHQTTPVPFSDTPPPSRRSTAKSNHPHSSALICRQYSACAIHSRPGASIEQATIFPFSNILATPCRVRLHRLARPRLGAELALPAKLMLIHSHGGTA